jgi:hypothetical protein
MVRETMNDGDRFDAILHVHASAMIPCPVGLLFTHSS